MDPRTLLENGVEPLIPFFERVEQAAFPGFGDDFSNFTHLLSDLQRFLVPLLTDPNEMARVLAMPTPQRKSGLP